MPKKSLIPNNAKRSKTVKKPESALDVNQKIKDVVKGLGFEKTETAPELDSLIQKLREPKE